MSIIIILIVLALIGLAVWALTTYVPMAPGFRTVIYVVAIIAVILWLLQAFGLLDIVTQPVKIGR